MKKNIAGLVCLLMVSLFISCNQPSNETTTTTADSTAGFDKQWATKFIDSINAKISQQFAAGDSAALAAHYWPDAELLFTNSEPIRGKDILPAWGAMIRMGIKTFNFSTTDLTGDGKYMIETGGYEMKDDKANMLERGKYVVVWEQRNGEWKLYRDIGNASPPVAK